MKKHKLIKSLLFTPLATIPLVAAVGCGSTPSKTPAPEQAAANALVTKFKDAKNFVSITNSDQNKAYSNFRISSSATDKTKTPTKNFFLDDIITYKTKTKSNTVGNTTTYNYNADGAPYLYIWAQEYIQNPEGGVGTFKNQDVLVAEINENLKVEVNKDAEATDNGTVSFTGYKKDDEVNQFKMTTADSQLYIANMLYAMSVNVNKKPSGDISIDEYKAAYNTVTSTSTKFVANKTFEDSASAELTYEKQNNKITYVEKSSGAVFAAGAIVSGKKCAFKGLAYNLNLATGMLTFTGPAVLTTPS